MSALAARVAAFLVAPAFPPPEAAGADASPTAVRPVPAAALAPAPRVAVVGDGGAAAAFAVDLTRALAARTRRRVAVTATWGGPAPTAPRGQAVAAAERVAAALRAHPGAAEHGVAAGGTGVVVGLPTEPPRVAEALAGIAAAAGEATTVVLAVCGPRPAAVDAVLTVQDLIVLVLPVGAVPGLEAMAVAALADAAPRADVVVVTLPGPGLPRRLRHRPPVRRVLDALEARDAR